MAGKSLSKPDTQRIFLTNLKIGLKSDELKCKLIQVLPTYFNGDNLVEVFKPKERTINGVSQLTCYGLVSGLDVIFSDLEKATCGKEILGRKIVIKKDRGDERDEFGDFKTPMAPVQRRQMNVTDGVLDRKVTRIFKSSFLNQVNPEVYDGKNRTIFINPANFKRNDVNDVLKHFCPGSHPVTSTQLRLKYHLETFQAIRFLNNNPAFGITELSNMDRKFQSNLKDRKGLGDKGEFLNFTEISSNNHGIVPFGLLDKDILDLWKLNNGFHSNCWKCEAAGGQRNPKYKLIGVDLDMNFIAGTCSCSYDSSLDVIDEKRAYHWLNEPYTRLTLGEKDSLEIFHQPMQRKYDSPVAYMNITLPILQEEYYKIAQEFKMNQVLGKIQELRFLEAVSTVGKNRSIIYSAELVVPKSRFWNVENRFGIRKISILLPIRSPRGQLLQIPHRGTVHRMNEEVGVIRIFVQVKGPNFIDTDRVEGCEANVIPLADKTEYENIKSCIRKWVQKDAGNEFLSLYWSPQAQQVWTFTPKVPRGSEKLNIIEEICKPFNEKQKDFFDSCVANKISILHGPPGTGKTTTLSISAIGLLILEGGRGGEGGPIVVATPSNVAANNAADMIFKWLGRVSPAMELPKLYKVLRIFSKGREFDSLASIIEAANAPRHEAYTILHEEVALALINSDKEEMKSFFQKMKNGAENRLKKAEMKEFEKLVSLEEQKVMDRHDVFVSTIAALSDKRVENWTEEQEIKTIILDEAGQVGQAYSIPMFSLKPKRIIFAGDFKQLMPQVTSSAAKRALLELSPIEWIDKSRGESKVPWTMLEFQHRMRPKICRLVSTVFYNGQLKTADVVDMREYNYNRDRLCSFVPEFEKSSMLVLDVAGLETRMETSYRNDAQVACTMDMVHKLLGGGVPGKDITILTLYEAQKLEIMAKLNLGLENEHVQLFNVDGFQGRENSVVIVNLVRSNLHGDLGFASNSNRLCVALSRAMDFLIIVCNMDTVKNHRNQHVNLLLDELQKVAVTKPWPSTD